MVCNASQIWFRLYFKLHNAPTQLKKYQCLLYYLLTLPALCIITVEQWTTCRQETPECSQCTHHTHCMYTDVHTTTEHTGTFNALPFPLPVNKGRSPYTHNSARWTTLTRPGNSCSSTVWEFLKRKRTQGENNEIRTCSFLGKPWECLRKRRQLTGHLRLPHSESPHDRCSDDVKWPWPRTITLTTAGTVDYQRIQSFVCAQNTVTPMPLYL